MTLYKPSATQTLLWDIAAAALKLGGCREGTRVERLATLCEMQAILREALEMCGLAIEQLDDEIAKGKEVDGEQLAFRLKDWEAS